jgi:multicomponent Na+:H+ antiporter subunit D
MPITAKTALVASLSISGIPPFNGFWSKLFIILACVQAGKIGLASVAVLGSILTLASFTKVQKYVFFGKAQSTAQKIKEAHWLMGASMIAFSLLCLVGGILFPFVVNVFINPAVVAVINGVGYGRMVLGGN